MVVLRLAEKGDIKLLFEWRNDVTVRMNSIYTKPILYENHCTWFDKKQQDINSNIYICMYGGQPIGQIRIDYQENKAEISYSLAKEYRGKGLGEITLHSLEEKECVRLKGKTLTGIVKRNNIASQRCFEKLGYTKKIEDDYVYYSKEM